jgi:hypothetical protein
MAETVKHTPDRIWVEYDAETNEKRWFSIRGMGIEYVRGDIANEMLEALRASIALCDKNTDGGSFSLAPEAQEVYDLCMAVITKATGADQ